MTWAYGLVVSVYVCLFSSSTPSSIFLLSVSHSVPHSFIYSLSLSVSLSHSPSLSLARSPSLPRPPASIFFHPPHTISLSDSLPHSHLSLFSPLSPNLSLSPPLSHHLLLQVTHLSYLLQRTAASGVFHQGETEREAPQSHHLCQRIRDAVIGQTSL